MVTKETVAADSSTKAFNIIAKNGNRKLGDSAAPPQFLSSPSSFALVATV